MEIISIVIAILLWLAAMQVSANDIRRLAGKINHRWVVSNTVAFICMVLAAAAIVYDCVTSGILTVILEIVIALILSVIWTWVLSKINTQSFVLVVILLWLPLAFAVGVGICGFSGAVVCGLYYRNCPFGNLFGKKFLLFKNNTATAAKPASEEGVPVEKAIMDELQDFSYAGCQHAENEMPVFDVTAEGIIPDSREDSLEKLQNLIDRVGESGGGCIYFPNGRYYINKNKTHPGFIQINYSNITLKGETDSDGRPVAELINCNHTADGTRNPWLSPFMITTGENLQQSNMFWGIQFKNRKDVITRSGSMSDPGSDGTILTPDFATEVIASAEKGDVILKVKDASALRGVKYIMFALYNNPDGDLIRDILDMDELRPEWKTALRAGEEMAPSYQALLEIDSIDESSNTVILTQPLRRNIDLKNTPELFAVEMLEDVCIKDLLISSTWNGLFKHHGFRMYYSAAQAQEMDYGWNGINMKRVAHGRIENVIFKNQANPLYLMDSRNVTVENLLFTGYDGHQGIKVYEHACDNLLRHIEFRNHYADMMGGEGNAYGNVFSDVRYTNPYLKPVDFDFHGFSEGPMSPPSYNLFECVHGFSYIKAGGALYNQPACARNNVFWNLDMDGEQRGDDLFINSCYVPEKKFKRVVGSLLKASVSSLHKKDFSPASFMQTYKAKYDENGRNKLNPEKHHMLFPESRVIGIRSSCEVRNCKESTVRVYYENERVMPVSLYKHQLDIRIGNVSREKIK